MTASADSPLSLYLLPETLTTAPTYAVCNDHSPAGYYLRPGVGAAASQWIIHLEGGYWCWDAPSCASRVTSSPLLVSSKEWPQTRVYGGLFNTTVAGNPDFSDWTMVYVPYCTSDGWAGTVPPPPATDFRADNVSTWAFRGRAVVQAVLRDLQLRRGLSRAAGADVVLFSGCSAGGQGVLVNLDAVEAFFASSDHLPVYGLADAGWLMDVQPDPSSGRAPLSSQIQGAMVMWGAQFNAACTGALGEAAAWRCFFGEYVAPFFNSSRVVVQAESFDSFQLWYDANINNLPPPPATAAWLTAYHSAFVQTIISRSSPTPSGLGLGVFSPACHWHCNTQSEQWTTLTVGGVSLHDAVSRLVYKNAPVHIVDTCAGFGGCSVGCP